MPDVTIADIHRLFNEFREQNDARLAEIERTGAASAETNERVDRLNDTISEMQARLNRPRATPFGQSLQPTDLQLQVYAAWQSLATRQPVDPNDIDLDLIRGYNRAFNDVMRRGDRASVDSHRILNEMSVGLDPDGGYLVSPDTTGRTVQLVYESSPMRQIASVQPISSDELQGMNDLDEAAASWVGETETRSDTTTPQVGLWKIPVQEQYSQPRATQKLLDDSAFNVENWLASKVSTRFARAESTAFVTGNGTNRPRGFTTYAAGTPSAATWNVIQQVNSGAAAALTADGLIDLVFSLKTAYRANARFAMNRTTERDTRKLKDGDGGYMWQPDLTQMGAARLLGFPIVEFPDMPAIGAGNEPIGFGDFREAYQIVDRIGIRVLRDPYTAKPYVRFYTTKRVGGDVVNFEAIKLQTISA